MVFHANNGFLRLDFLILTIIVIAIRSTHAQSDYCSICRDHTMCLYQGVSPNCRKGVFRNGVSAAEQTQVIAAHNDRRNRVASGAETQGNPGPQPQAANMRRLQWDTELANIAQRWADQCNYNHDKCRTVSRYQVGQNIALGSSSPCDSNSNTTPDWNGIVSLWYNEVRQFDRNGVDSYRFATNTGHYSQVVWADTDRLGCGYTMFQDGNWCNKYYVCNYGISGNWGGQSVYIRGTPRTRCPSGSSPTSAYPALC